MKETRMLPAYSANLVANSDTIYGVSVIAAGARVQSASDRGKHLVACREYRACVQRKKRNFRHKNVQHVTQVFVRDKVKLWKALDRLSNTFRTKNGPDGDMFANHFESLSKSPSACHFNEEYKQRFLTPGHQGWNDLHSLCRIGMEYYLLNNDDNNIIYWIMMIIMIMMMIIIMIIMMTIIGTATIMIMIIIITTTLTMTIMKMIMIKTAQTPCQSLYKDRRI